MGVANVGHAHPEVVAAVRAQAERYLHVMVYGEFVQETQVRLAARLATLLPPPLSRVYFTSSGAEAIEGAIKTARKATGRPSWSRSTAASTATRSVPSRSAATRSTAPRSSRCSPA